MLYVFHGEHIAKSRSDLLALKQEQKSKEIRELEGKSITDNELVQALSSHSLFVDDRAVVVEHLFGSLGKKIKRTEELISLLKQYEQEVDIILWEDKELSKSLLSKLGKNAKIKHYSYPTVLFQMLDSLAPEKSAQCLLLLRTVLQTEVPEVVHVLLKRRFLQLIKIKTKSDMGSLQPWQISRLTNQAGFFTMEQLLNGYKNLLNIELLYKSGTAVLDLPQALELAITQM